MVTTCTLLHSYLQKATVVSRVRFAPVFVTDALTAKVLDVLSGVTVGVLSGNVANGSTVDVVYAT